MPLPDVVEIRKVIENITDPVIGKTLGELDHIKEIIFNDSSLDLKIIINTYNTQKTQLEEAIKSKLEKLGISQINLIFEVEITKQIPSSDYGPPGMKALDPLPKIKNIIAIASNKGGVGKSTVAANLVCAFRHIGAKVALMDLDLYGPNIPTMFGVNTQRATYEEEAKDADPTNEGLIKVIEKFGIPMMSVGFILPEDDTAVVLRAPLVNRLIMEFLNEVDWPESDYLIVDLPPGTGDIQLTLAQQMPNSLITFVTTPQQVALADVYKGIKMFTDPEIKIPVLGIIENMSYFKGDDGKTYEIFGKGGGEKVAKDFNIDLFGKIPIVQQIREQGDIGEPLVHADPSHEVSQLYIQIANDLAGKIAKLNHEVNLKREKMVYEELDLM